MYKCIEVQTIKKKKRGEIMILKLLNLQTSETILDKNTISNIFTEQSYVLYYISTNNTITRSK